MNNESVWEFTLCDTGGGEASADTWLALYGGVPNGAIIGQPCSDMLYFQDRGQYGVLSGEVQPIHVDDCSNRGGVGNHEWAELQLQPGTYKLVVSHHGSVDPRATPPPNVRWFVLKVRVPPMETVYWHCQRRTMDQETRWNAGHAVAMIHGLNLSGNTNCSDVFGPLDVDLGLFGHTGQRLTIGYYGSDSNCNLDAHLHPTAVPDRHDRHEGVTSGSRANHYACGNTPSGFCHDADTPIEHLAYHVAWTLKEEGKGWDIVGHSMGGLIARYALAYARYERDNGCDFRDNCKFPELNVQDAMTHGTPHLGVPAWSSALCALWWNAPDYECGQWRVTCATFRALVTGGF